MGRWVQMNKIFKVIFSKAKGCYVVVSELAKSIGGVLLILK